MINKKTNLDALNDKLFETIEMLQNNTDKKGSSPNERIDVETARAIAELGKVIISGYRVKSDVVKYMAMANNPELAKQIGKQQNLIEQEVL